MEKQVFSYDYRRQGKWDTLQTDTRIAFIKIDTDDAPMNPLKDMDGYGSIHSFSHRHVNYMDPDEARDILKTNKFAVPLSYYEHGNSLWMVAEGPTPAGVEFQWDGARFAGIWEPTKDDIENIKASLYHSQIKIIQYARWQGQPEHKDACPWILEVAGEKFSTWKKARAHARKLATIKHGKNARKVALREATHRYATQACEIYTSWCNGDVYGFTIEIYDIIKDKDGEPCDEIRVYQELASPITEDSCWGFYGSDEINGTITTDHIQPLIDQYLNTPQNTPQSTVNVP